MKFMKFIIALALVCLMATTASAQRSFDLFGVPRTVALGVTNFGYNGGVTTVTNGPFDVRMFDGIAKIDVLAYTNTGATGGTLTAQIYGSADTTNLIALANVGVAVNKTIVYSNYYYSSTPLKATNIYELGGTITTPTAYSAGFATPYLAPVAFTNAGAISVTNNLNNGLTTFGLNIGDVPRYLYIVYTAGGTVTNWTVGASLTGIAHDTLTY